MTPMALARSRWVFWAVLPALLAAEIVTTFVSAPIGLALHGLVALQVLLPVEAQHCKAVYGCADPACLRLVVAALKIGLDASELQELLELYGSTPPGQRSLPRFFDLLARYSRTIAFRASICSDARSTIQRRVC